MNFKEFFSCFGTYSLANLATMSDSRNRVYSLLSISSLVPPYSGSRTVSPTWMDIGTTSPLSLRAPGPAATTVPSKTFPCDFSGMIIPPFVLVKASALCTRIRSKRGIKRFKDPETDCKRKCNRNDYLIFYAFQNSKAFLKWKTVSCLKSTHHDWWLRMLDFWLWASTFSVETGILNFRTCTKCKYSFWYYTLQNSHFFSENAKLTKEECVGQAVTLHTTLRPNVIFSEISAMTIYLDSLQK